MTKPRDLVRAVFAVALAVPAVASCSSLLGIDEYHDSASELCDLLGPCYNIVGCTTKVSASLNGATAGVRAEWLRALSDKRCLDSCKAARRCLDYPPLCAPVGTPCQNKDECCGFNSGSTECRVKGASSNPDAGTPDASTADAGPSGPSVCCSAEGAHCTSSDECCQGSCDGHTGICGKACRAPGTACSDNFDCCTKICRDNKCSEDICVDLDGVCTADADCCNGTKCLLAKDNRKRCGNPPCSENEGPCGDPGGPSCCTTGAPLDCVTVLDVVPSPTGAPGVCLPAGQTCFPNDYPCATKDDCCGGYCDPLKQRCGTKCASTDASCTTGAECCSQVCTSSNKCDCSTEYCTTNDDCCSHNCVGGVCGATCGVKTCDHDECIPGGPLDETLCQGSTTVDAGCVGTVCTNDPYCCCVAWDAVCTIDAVNNCGVGVAICN